MFYCQKFLDRMGWSQTDLAEKLGSKQSRVSNWNTGLASPRYNEIMKLIELGANLEELFGSDVAAMLISRVNPVEMKLDVESTEFAKGIEEAVIASLLNRLKQR